MRNISTDILDTPIYRIISIERLFEMFEMRKLILPKVNTWEDPYENFFLKSDFLMNTNVVTTTNVRNRIYGQCWSKFKDSDALWRMYSPEKKCVRIKTTVAKLFNTIYTNDDCSDKSYVGFVSYKTKKEITKWVKNKNVNMSSISKITVNSQFIKRNNFSHEKEVRIIHILQTFVDCPNFVKFDINVHDFIENITFDPRVDDSFYESIRQQIKREYHYKLSRINKSVLYKFDPIGVEIR